MADVWWLKVKRAQFHTVEIHREMRRYADIHPYRAVPVRQSKGLRHLTYALEMTAQPAPMAAVVLGEFVHNLRSALDNIVVACAPRNRKSDASFPIQFRDMGAGCRREVCHRR